MMCDIYFQIHRRTDGHKGKKAHINGHTNGHANGHANGHKNGYTNGASTSSKSEPQQYVSSIRIKKKRNKSLSTV